MRLRHVTVCVLPAVLISAGVANEATGLGAEPPVLVPYKIAGDAVQEPLAGLKGDARRGIEIILDRRIGNCLICHAFPVENEPFQGEIGPSMTDVGGRLSEAQIRLRMIDESAINPATVMPPYYRVENLTNVAPEYAGKPALSAQQLEDVVAYLSSLKR